MPAGATVRQAVEACGVLQKYPEIDLANNKLGVFAKLVKPDAPLRDRDRVEIYRPLIADPKEVRKQRAADGKAMKKVRQNYKACFTKTRTFTCNSSRCLGAPS